MLMAAFALTGKMLSIRVKNRVKALEKLRLMIRLMQAEIEYVNMPTYEMLRNASERKELSDLFFVKECLKMIDDGNSFDHSWSRSVQKTKPPELENDDVQLILSFGKSLGTTDRNGQLGLCGMYEDMIAQRIQEASAKAKSHAELYSKLGLICGVAIVIILI